ncbi:hypothetical protein RRF57_010712 [Xylaria bambusicola]|uniref:Uncharacterized protein n=1 Tax=Xylaria bambusicola TaxID=326684 RepID=A0AAN7Z300_9PEZI
MEPIQFLPGPPTLEPLEIDTDTEHAASTTTDSGFDGIWDNFPPAPSRSPCMLADLSNYLGISRSEDDDVVLKRVGTAPLTRGSSRDTDSYGWESGYDRRPSCGNVTLGRSCHRLRCHRP